MRLATKIFEILKIKIHTNLYLQLPEVDQRVECGLLEPSNVVLGQTKRLQARYIHERRVANGADAVVG